MATSRWREIRAAWARRIATVLIAVHFAIVARDGFPVRFPEMADTLSIAPGEVYDVEVTADNPGAWAFHCHVLGHAEGPQGMFGMVTALIVS